MLWTLFIGVVSPRNTPFHACLSCFAIFVGHGLRQNYGAVLRLSFVKFRSHSCTQPASFQVDRSGRACI
jgi:hypothetical protein